MEKVKVGVVGIGYLGSEHARIYSKLPDAELVALCDVDPSKKALARKYRTPFYEDYQTLFDKVDAVSIATPTQDHHRAAKAFLEHGLHVLIEKPITKSVEEADELVAIARRNRCLIQVGHVERFNSALQTIRPYVQSAHFLECHRLGPFKRRSLDVGVVLDLMIHDIDIILSLIPSPVERVDAVGIHVLTDKEDIANARLNFKNGAAANLTASRLTSKSMRKIRIFSENSYISLDTYRQKVDRYWKEGDRIRMEKLRVKKKEPLQEELASFIQAVFKKEKPLVSGEEAREALRVALQIEQLIRSNPSWSSAKGATLPQFSLP
ncbi:MAG: Gfo/Idh/MocA family oxidoreductase [Candidatus Omnitrophica bacterium]|nr:Gfo/Idh/MocA family oxidoreductase [Candidatus Omnitrophota bacterium]